jgi:hypothetical protein
LQNIIGVDRVELFGDFHGLSADDQVESSDIDNPLISSVNEQFARHRCSCLNFF